MVKSPGKVLLADDDEFVLLSLKVLLEQHKIEVVSTSNPERIMALLEKENVHAVMLDMNFRAGDTSSTQGLFWLGRILEFNKDLPVIPLTAYGDISLAVEAMKRGAHDFITKPWENEKLLATIKNAIILYEEKQKVKVLTAQQKILTTSTQQQSLIGSSSAIEQIKNKIEKIAPTDTSVLISGDNGTGKEVIAREIHRCSKRNSHVFISVDVGSLSESIFESELFGHKKGAFTDAKEDRIGRIEAAHGGTLFLDEIGNLPLSLQAKLLSVLQHKIITRLGTNQPIAVDVRIVCATNSNLQGLVKEGKFREDLYYRINTVEIGIPPLAERQEDIPLLVMHFLNKNAQHYQKEDRYIPEEVMTALQKYRWPGNVRELQHAVERAVILSENQALSLEDFGISRHLQSGELIFDHLNLEKLEAWAIRKAIAKHKGNISHAAQELGLSRGAMYRRMERYAI
ncbi:sigma-54-dependent Fis family transcriptional regulator [Chryseotalea sanaruensis]|uniref:Sigma-54-dependent Fis family transcriptional regulator n=1 Tax=Chryseotalea sanaruensis TaxID=2482724 RepID=A0A401UAQ1_9BACT|nr:sigma-54 dependent transcriptional regulator [Chryseotalea sanaruensis]GCC51969.1 sigma-54-dependent Fis family transcriptional regulator [Chryseotalea sanaruensis]